MQTEKVESAKLFDTSAVSPSPVPSFTSGAETEEKTMETAEETPKKKRGPKPGFKRKPKPEVAAAPVSETPKLNKDGTPRKKRGPKPGFKRKPRVQVQVAGAKKPGRPKMYKGATGQMVDLARARVQELEQELAKAAEFLAAAEHCANTAATLGL